VKRAEKTGKPDFKGKVRVALGGLALWQFNMPYFGENTEKPLATTKL
jgi:hypothetical protein